MSRIMDIIQQVKDEGRDRLTVVTHSGRFHLDELLALSMLLKITSEQEIQVVIRRTRRPEIIEIADLVLDVGYLNEGKYMDHHDISFKEYHQDTGVKLATTGLVWQDIKTQLLEQATEHISAESKPKVQQLAEEIIYNKLIIPTDMMDNGQSKGHWTVSLSFEEIVTSFNDEEENSDQQFIKAFEMVYQVFTNKLRDIIKTARDDNIVVQAVEQLDPELSEKGILTVPGRCNWLSSVKRHWDDTRHLKICVYPDETAPDIWKIQTLPGDKYARYEQRCSAPEQVKGFNRLTADTYPEDIPFKDQLVFVHSNGFLGSFQGTQEEALAFAAWWVENTSTPPYVVPTEQEYQERWNNATIISGPPNLD